MDTKRTAVSAPVLTKQDGEVYLWGNFCTKPKSEQNK